MMRSRVQLTSMLLMIVLGVSAGCSWQRTVPESIIPKGKKATALVEVRTARGVSQGCAFCIDTSGVFVTNAHVVENAVKYIAGDFQGGSVELVLNPGEAGQWIGTAEVVSVDRRRDLAVLKAEPDLSFRALELGTDDEVVETLPVTAFGFPFGSALALQSGGYPSASVNSIRVSSLRKVDGKLELVQLDGSLNPGNSGGPVVDQAGRVIGVVQSGVMGAGINFAIPVGRLSEYLGLPKISFRPSPVPFDEREKPVKWTVKLTPGMPGAKVPNDLTVSLTVQTKKEGRLEFREPVVAQPARDGSFHAEVVPVPHSDRKVRVAATIDGKSRVLKVPDVALTINGKAVALGDIESLVVEENNLPRVTLRDGRTEEGTVTGLGKTKCEEVPSFSPASRNLLSEVDLARATQIYVARSEDFPDDTMIDVLVKVERGSTVLATETRRVELQNKPIQVAAAPTPVVPVPASSASTVSRPSSPRVPNVVSQRKATGQELVDAEGKLDAPAAAVGAGKSIRPPKIRVPDATVSKGVGRSAEASEPGDDVRTIDVPQVAVDQVAFSPDGKLLAVGSRDGHVELLNTATGRRDRLLAAGSGQRAGLTLAGAVQRLTFSKDGKTLLAGIGAEQPKLWDLVSGRLSRPFGYGNDLMAGEAMLEPNGRRALVRGKGALGLWDVATAKLLHEFPQGSVGWNSPIATDWSQLLVVVEDSGQQAPLRFFDLETGSQRWEAFLDTDTHNVTLAGCDLLPGSGGCVVVLKDGTVSVRDRENGKELRRLKLAVPPRYRSAAVVPDGKSLVTGHDDGIIRLWDLADGRELSRAKFPAAGGLRGTYRVGFRALPSGIPAFSPDGRSVAVGGSSMVNLWTLPKAARPGRVEVAKKPSDTLVRALPGNISEIIPAGAGRYLLLIIRDTRKLAVFDANAADVVKVLSLPSENVLVAGGAEKFLVVFPDERIIQRWDLARQERETSAPLPIRASVWAIAMGSDSTGPALVFWSARQQIPAGELGRFSFIDPASLKVRKVSTCLTIEGISARKTLQREVAAIEETQPYLSKERFECELRASADGSLFTFRKTQGQRSDGQVIAVRGGEVEIHHDSNSRGPQASGPDGLLVYDGASGVRDLSGRQVLDPASPNNHSSIYLPSADPAYFIGLRGLGKYLSYGPLGTNNADKLEFGVSIFTSGSTTPLATLDGMSEMQDVARATYVWSMANPTGISGRPNSGFVDWWRTTRPPTDLRFHWVPAAKLFITIPVSNDRLVLRHFDLAKALDQFGGDYLLVTSARALTISPGEKLRHQLEVKSRKGGVKFTLSRGPDGLTVSPAGLLEWTVPAGRVKDEREALITVQDASGQSLFHTLKLRGR